MAESCKIEGCLSVYGAGINMILLRPELTAETKLLIITLKPDGFLLAFWTCVLTSSADLEAEPFVLSCLFLSCLFGGRSEASCFLANGTVEFGS